MAGETSEKLSSLIGLLKDPEKSGGETKSTQLIEILEKVSKHPVTHVHNRLENFESSPVQCDLLNVVKELNSVALSGENNKLDCLLKLLAQVHMKSVLSCHDKVANKEYDNVDNHYEAMLSDDMSDEESMNIVQILKTDEPLGATISYDDSNEKIIVARILRGGALDKLGVLHTNDIILEINKKSTADKTPTEVTKILSEYRGSLTIKLLHGKINTATEPMSDSVYIKPHFSFDPKTDDLIPCPKAGLSFTAGDILCVLSKDEKAWWQATKVRSNGSSDDSMQRAPVIAGIVPSIYLQTRREKLKRQIEKRRKLNESASIKGSNLSLMSRQRRTAWGSIKASFRRKNNSATPDVRKRLAERSTSVAAGGDSLSPPFFPPYQVVAKIDPPASTGQYRPIVLVGPTGVGRNELKERLIDSDPVLYGVPVPHTSRAKLPNERDGIDYHFVSRQFMQSGVRDKIFLEFGEYKGNLYGTSIDAVHAVTRANQICILTPGPQALGILRTKELKPYVIFVKPPTMENADGAYIENESAPMLRPKLTLERETISPLELCDLVNRAEQMRRQFGRLFDTSITYDEPLRALEKLKGIVHTIQNHSHYVPVEWTKPTSSRGDEDAAVVAET